MNLRSLLIGTALIAIPIFSTSVRADENVPEGSIYRGNGYTVYLVRDAYKGCDANNRCLEIEHAAIQTPRKSVWKNHGYTYSMLQLGEQNGRPTSRLKVVNPQGKVILNIVMKLEDYFN